MASRLQQPESRASLLWRLNLGFANGIACCAALSAEKDLTWGLPPPNPRWPFLPTASSGVSWQRLHEIIAWLEAAARGWNANPTPFEWGGKRKARRQRARERRHALAGSGAYTRRPIARRSRRKNGYARVN
jgi:hypothetical protein